MYVKRNKSNEIIGISKWGDENHTEYLDDNDIEVASYKDMVNSYREAIASLNGTKHDCERYKDELEMESLSISVAKKKTQKKYLEAMSKRADCYSVIDEYTDKINNN